MKQGIVRTVSDVWLDVMAGLGIFSSGMDMSDLFVKTRKFLNGIFNGSRTIKSIEYRDTDLQSLEEDGRNSSLDILCTDQNGDRYAIEIQCNAQKYYVDRALFYASSIYARSGKKGEWDYSVKDVVSINILNFALKDDEKWIFGLKNISTMKHYESLGELKEDFKRILELADKAALTEEERLLYEQQEKNLRDIVNQVEYAEENGLAKGMEKGIQLGVKKTAISMKQEGISTELIAKITGLPLDDIAKL